MALEGLIEALNFTDVLDETVAANWAEATPGLRTPTIGEVARGVPATAVIAEGIALPAELNAFKTPSPSKKRPFDATLSEGTAKRHRPTRGGAVTPPRFSFGGPTQPFMPRIRRSINTGGHSLYRFPARRYNYMPTVFRRSRRPVTKARNRYTRRRIPRQPRTNVKIGDTLSRGSSHNNRIVVIKRLQRAPNPTTQEGGGSLTSRIINANSATSPDGQFGFSYSFKLSQMTSYTDFTAMYQWYKLLWVKLHFVPLQGSVPGLIQGTATNPILDITENGGNTPLGQAGELVIAPDRTSEALFTSVSIAMAHDGAVLHTFNDNKELTVFLQPRALGLVGAAGSEVATENASPRWITTSDATVAHYGLRCFATMQDNASYRVNMEMKFAFKGPKH